MTPQTNTAAQHASEAAEALRALNHTLQTPAGRYYQGNAYDTVGALSEAAGRLPQAIDQTCCFIESQYANSQFTAVHGDLHAHVSQTEGALIDAAKAASALFDALERAHGALSLLGYRE